MTSGTPRFSLNPSDYEDPSGRAERMCRFVENLTLWEGDRAGQPFHLYDFQRSIIRRIYGPCDDNGNRLVRTACIWIPRGNAKTTLLAALADGHLLGPECEPGGQVVMAAADRENAGIAFKHAHEFIKADDALSSRIRPIESRKYLEHPKSASTLKAISSEAYSKHGLNVSFFLADEIHSWTPAEARPLFKTVTDSMVKRPNPLTVIISTAGSGQGGLAHDWWDYSHKVASGEIDDPTFAPIIIAADPDKDWRDEEAWHEANPAINAGFCYISELRTKAKRIEHFPAEIADFKRFHLNQWQEGAAEPWISTELYDAADQIREDLEALPCWIGVDVSSTEDLTAVVAVFPDGNENRRDYHVYAHFFLPKDNIAIKSELDQANYLKWADEGYLSLTPGNEVDQDQIVEKIIELHERYDVQGVSIDRWNSTGLIQNLLKEDINAVKFGQGFVSMAAPVKEIKRAILSGRFRHGGNPLLRMCFNNVVAETDAAENEKFTKAKANGRIDGAVASAMAIGLAMTTEIETNVYERREEGFTFL